MVLLFCLLYPACGLACVHTGRPADSEALVVQVTPEQSAWNIHYAGPDGVFGLIYIS